MYFSINHKSKYFEMILIDRPHPLYNFDIDLWRPQLKLTAVTHQWLWCLCRYNFYERLKKVMFDSGKKMFTHSFIEMWHTFMFGWYFSCNKTLLTSTYTFKALCCTQTSSMCLLFFQRRETWWQEQNRTWYLIMSMLLLPLLPHWCCSCVWAQLRLKCESSEPSGLQNMSHNQTWLMNNSEHFLCQEEERL